MDLSQLDPSLLAEFYNWQQQVQDGAIETVAPSAVAPPPAKSAAPAPPRGSAPLKLTVKLNINSKAVNQEQQERLRALCAALASCRRPRPFLVDPLSRLVVIMIRFEIRN